MTASLMRSLSCSRSVSEGGNTNNRFLPQYGLCLVESVLQAIQSATDNAELEFFAAVKIQATFRMYTARTRFQHVRSGIVHLQSVYRGHAQRRRTEAHRAHVEKQRLLAVFHTYATMIQACFRGFYSRKHRDNYYKTKRYLAAVTNRSNEVLALSEEVNNELNALVRLRDVTAEETAYMKATEKVHYLLSTATSRGVYNPPSAPLLVSTTAGEPVATATSCEEGTMNWVRGGSGDGKGGERQSMMSSPSLSQGTRTVFQTHVEDDIRTNATAARQAALQKARVANATTKIVTGTAGLLYPPPSLSLSTAAAIAGKTATMATTTGGLPSAWTVRPVPGDGVGGGSDIIAVDGGLTVGGLPEREVRKERQARRDLYGRSVRASHYPRASHGDANEEEGAAGASHFASSAPARTGGATVASRSIGVGAEAGVLPPIRPKRRLEQQPQTTTHPFSSSSEGALSSHYPYTYSPDKDSKITRDGLPVDGDNKDDDGGNGGAALQWQEEEEVLGSSSSLPVPWQNADSMPRPRQPVGPAKLEQGARGKKKKPTAALGVSSRSKAFHIPSHDCRDHMNPRPPLDYGVSGGGSGGAALSTSAVATSPQAAEEGFASVSLERPNLLLNEKPLYDREKASLQRSVDAQVRKALHGKATFKV